MSKRKSLTLEQKLEIIDQIAGGVCNSVVSRTYHLPCSTVSTIWKNRDKIKGTSSFHYKRIREPSYKELDQALLNWYRQNRSQNLDISGHILYEKAKEIFKLFNGCDSDFISRSWIDRFKKRHCISSGCLPEPGDACTETNNLEEIKVQGCYYTGEISNPNLVLHEELIAGDENKNAIELATSTEEHQKDIKCESQFLEDPLVEIKQELESSDTENKYEVFIQPHMKTESEPEQAEDTGLDCSIVHPVMSAIKTINIYLDSNDLGKDIKDKFDFVRRTVEQSILLNNAESGIQTKITDYFK